MISKDTFIRGGKNSTKVILDLSKFIIPSILFIKILEHSGWLFKIAQFFAPYMAYMGLPGEGSLVFLLGQVSIYSAIGAITTLDWTVKQITIMSVLITTCHAIVVETAIVSKGGANGLLNAGLRLLGAIVSGLILNIVIPGV